MTATKHTAPPWTLKKLAGTNGPQAVIRKLPGGVDAIICLFIHSVGISKEEQLANAALIQKSPNLFRVLDDVNNALYRVDGDPEGLWRINQSALDSLAALMNELRGESL
jgi:hypothetical protein